MLWPGQYTDISLATSLPTSHLPSHGPQRISDKTTTKKEILSSVWHLHKCTKTFIIRISEPPGEREKKIKLGAFPFFLCWAEKHKSYGHVLFFFPFRVSVWLDMFYFLVFAFIPISFGLLTLAFASRWIQSRGTHHLPSRRIRESNAWTRVLPAVKHKRWFGWGSHDEICGRRNGWHK